MLTAPKLDYALLAPILIILGAALLGVIVEAFVKQALRARLQLVIALAGISIAFGQLYLVRNEGSSIAAVTSVSIDGSGIFIQGAILLFAFLGILIIADQDHFAPQASALPGSSEEASALESGKQQTEVFPLTLFAVSGAMLFPIATDWSFSPSQIALPRSSPKVLFAWRLFIGVLLIWCRPSLRLFRITFAKWPY